MTWLPFTNARRRGCILAALLTASVAQADEGKFGSAPRPTISSAFDLIQTPVASFQLGTAVSFQRQNTTAAKALAATGFQVRIFRVRDANSLPEHYYKIDDCNIYFSMVHPIAGTNSAEIKFADMDESWLNLSYSRSSVEDGHYYLVFEMRNADDEIFRLRSDHAARYFSQGFHLSVTTKGDILEQVKQRYAKREDVLTRLVAKITSRNSTIPCYEFKPREVRTASIEDQLATQDLIACNVPRSEEVPAREVPKAG